MVKFNPKFAASQQKKTLQFYWSILEQSSEQWCPEFYPHTSSRFSWWILRGFPRTPEGQPPLKPQVASFHHERILHWKCLYVQSCHISTGPISSLISESCQSRNGRLWASVHHMFGKKQLTFWLCDLLQLLARPIFFGLLKNVRTSVRTWLSWHYQSKSVLENTISVLYLIINYKLQARMVLKSVLWFEIFLFLFEDQLLLLKGKLCIWKPVIGLYIKSCFDLQIIALYPWIYQKPTASLQRKAVCT